jgi:hypothetical protein
MKSIYLSLFPVENPFDFPVVAPTSVQEKWWLRAGYGLLIAAIAIAFFTRIVAVFTYVTFDIGPDPDQIRDAMMVMKMWQGDFPKLGPPASLGTYHILPLYYYLFWPFTLLGADPRFQAFPNAFFSFLSVPLLSYLVYQFVAIENRSIRIFVSGLAGFWYSFLYGEIFISNFQWNPSSVPFFWMAFALLYKVNLDAKYRLSWQIASWAATGVVLAILVSLHASSLFIMPIMFGLCTAWYGYKTLNKQGIYAFVLPCIAELTCLVMLLPYWLGESQRSFRNTKSIIKALLGGGADNSDTLLTLSDKVYNLFFNTIKLFQQLYLYDSSWLALGVSVAFLGLVFYWGVFKFKGDKAIFFVCFSTLLVFAYAASSLPANTTIFYYKLLIIFVPIILAMAALAQLLTQGRKGGEIATVLLIVIGISCTQNALLDSQFMLSKYGSNRLVNTADIAYLLKQIPEGATLCEPKLGRKREEINQYQYIDTYLNRRQLQTSPVCQAGNYVIHPKQVMLIQSNVLNQADYSDFEFAQYQPSKSVELWPMFKVAKTAAIARPATLVKETSAAGLYRLG